jgi:lipoprotein signal peptidase
MARRFAVLLLAAGVVAGLDLTHKAIAVSERDGAVFAHPRSGLYVLVVAAASAAWVGAILLTGSLSIALSGGVLAGGAAGNVLSLALWPSVAGVPNPLIAGGVAFNVADLAVAAGVVLLIATTAAFAARNRERLREPVRLRS